jgi:acetylornithine deacetylase/succinyl-diaminopimelate desuccinylase-like protein
LSTVRDVVQENSDRYVSWLTEACSIPSMDVQPEGLVEMAEWLEKKFGELGASCERLTYEDAPDALLARIGSGERTVLIYDHYDVQPVDPLNLWNNPPFEPVIRDGVFFARGSADNKGDLVARLAALDAYKRLHGEPRVNVKFLVEGEEEVGSRNFEALIERHGDKLAADGCIWEGQGIDHAGRPSFVFGAKGLCYVELTLELLNDDQHSSIAVIAPNAGWRLMEALSTFRQDDGSVTIDGFYDDVEEPGEADLELLKNFPFDEGAEKARLGVEEFVGGATGLELLRRYYFEPTCNLAGFVTGFTVPNTSKTVLPREAMAKLDLRLVPNQDPKDIADKVRAHLDARGFQDIQMTTFSMEHPVRSPSDSLIGRASIAAAQDVFDEAPSVAPMMIGTGPMYPVAHGLGLPTVSPAGVCRPDSNIHAPNENCRIDDFLRIVEYTVAWLEQLEKID